MRDSVLELIRLGRLPDDKDANVPQLQAFESALNAIEQPLSDEEAVGLLSVFPSGESSCFGLAWSLLHLIETAPGWPCSEATHHGVNPWVKSMLERSESN